MPRRKLKAKRKILPDPKYGNIDLARFICYVMKDGKKALAEKIVYGALDQIQKGGQEEPLEVFHAALEKVKPAIEVKSRRVGGATYQVPISVHSDRSQALAMRWLVSSARKRGEKTMLLRLAGELLDASHEKGSAYKRRSDIHSMAEANKAFSHYRF